MSPLSSFTSSARAFTRLILPACLALSATACLISPPSPPSPPISGVRRVFDPNYPEWNYILAHYVTPEGVRYADLKKEQGRLEIALAKMAAVTPRAGP